MKQIFDSMSKVITVALVLLAVVALGDQCPAVSTWHGNFIVDGDITDCNVTLIGMRLDVMSLETIRGYGLLHTRCPDCSFTTVSAFEACDDCLICAHNEGVKKCQSILIPVMISTFFSVVICGIVLFAFLKLDAKVNLFERVFRCWQARTNYRRHRRVEKLRPLIETELEKITVKPDSNICKSAEGGNPSIPEVDKKPERTRRARAPSPTPSMIMAALLLTAGQVKTCDDTLMMSSEGTLLLNQKVTVHSSGLFVVHAGGTLCLKYPDGSKESLKLQGISRTLDYKPIYRACSFNVSTVSTYNCAWAGECWDETTCHQGYVKDSLKGTGPLNPNEHFDCEMVPNSSPSHCTHEQICVWYKWVVVPEYDVCDGILALSDVTTELNFEHTSRTGNVISFNISPGDPQVDAPLPLHLINYMISTQKNASHLRVHNGQFYKTQACDLNNPIPGLLGDMQVSFEGEDSVYPDWAVQCKADGSHAVCTTSEPGCHRSLNMDLRNPIVPYHVNSGLARVKNQERGSASLMFRSVLNPTLVIEQAICSIRVDYTYGCTSCNDAPFIVITPFDISVTGIMRIKSNCSFYLTEVECSPRAQKI